MKKFAWSFSALSRYESCPKQYWHMNVSKDVKDEDSEFAAEGRAIHEALFARCVKGLALPLNLRWLEPVAAKFVGLPGDSSGELKFAMSRNFEPQPYFGSDVFVRVVVDFLNVQGPTALVVDWKTGKVKPDFTQLKLTAAVLSTHLPEIETFKMAYVWVQHKQVSPLVLQKAQLLEVWNDLLPRVAKIEQAIKDTTFPARKSGLCGWCRVAVCPNNTNGDL